MGVITAAVIGTAGSIYASNKASKAQKEAIKADKEARAGADPYAAYRADAASRLNALSNDPSSVVGGAVWEARQLAASRAIASQGYTGSGNALIAAADAGASAYQQEFDNLARLSGADVGLQSAAGVASIGLQTRGNASDSYLSSIGGVVNNLGNLAQTVGSFNRPATSPSMSPAGTTVNLGMNRPGP